MKPSCEIISADLVTRWVDGALTLEESQAVSTHVTGCGICSALADSALSYRNRMKSYGAAKPALPAGFWETVKTGLDRVDVSTPDAPPTTNPPLWVLPLAVISAVVLISMGVYLGGGQDSNVLIDQKLAGIHRVSEGEEGPAADPDRAARWIESRLRAEIPVVNLTLVGARLTGVRVNRAQSTGSLSFETPRGARVTLHILTGGSINTAGMMKRAHLGTNYFVKESAGRTIAAWASGRRWHIVEGPMTWSELRPLAHEMARRCER